MMLLLNAHFNDEPGTETKGPAKTSIRREPVDAALREAPNGEVELHRRVRRRGAAELRDIVGVQVPAEIARLGVRRELRLDRAIDRAAPIRLIAGAGEDAAIRAVLVIAVIEVDKDASRAVLADLRRDRAVNLAA